MSDVSIGIETNLDDAGTKKLAADLSAAQAMTEALTKATDEQNRAATEATAATQEKTDAEADSTEGMRNLQGVGQQLNGALNGNITAMTRSITVTKEFAAQLQGAFSVLGALTFGYGVGTGIYKTIVDPLLSSQAAFKGVATEAELASVAIAKTMSAEHVQNMNELAAASKLLAFSYAETSKALENEISWTRKLIDARLDLEESKIMAEPASPERDRKMADFKARKTGVQADAEDQAAVQRRESAKAASEAASMQYHAALAELDRFKQQAFDKLPGLREQYNKRIDEARESEGFMATAAKMATPNAGQNPVFQNLLRYGMGPFALRSAFGKPNDEAGLEESNAALVDTMQMARIGKPDAIKQATDLQEKANAAKKVYEAALSEEEKTKAVSAMRREGATITKVAQITGVDQEEAANKAKAKAAAEKKALDDEKERLETERRLTKDKLDIGDRRGLPEQIRAQREAAEAQSASPKNYAKELAEAKAAEQKASEVIATLTATLQKLNEQYKQVQERIRNLPVQ